ncbi:hypothetical protein, partial [Roseixanthobacter liquoris]|uniref:hypothetical protein n=1 Tax=Roseixanthobacter liquoris TaxID=3119921 RepID=UPI003728596A
MDAEETRHRYSLFYQYSHLTRERDALTHEDRLEALAMLAAYFAPDLGVDPEGMAAKREEERLEELVKEMFEEADEIGGWPSVGRGGDRVAAARPHIWPW